MKKSELKSLIKMIVTESHDLYLGEEHPLPQDTHATDLNELAEDSGVVIQTVKGPYKFWADEDREEDNIKLFHYVKGPDGKEHYVDISPYEINWKSPDMIEKVKKWIESDMPNTRISENNLQENKTTMKKSELKALLKVIIQEVVAVKQKRIDETKGLSGFKKSKDSNDHTENVASSKDLTGKGPVEKQEGKKLPVVKKPATPQKVGSIKEEILEMIREAIDESDIEEIRVKGAVGSKFKAQDASSPTGWVVKGHKTIPDGTPTEAPKGPYIPKGIAGMGRPKKVAPVSSDGGTDFDTATRGAIENILTAAPNTTDNDIIQQLSSSASEEEVSLNLDPAFVKKTADALRKELSADTDNQLDDAPESDLAAMASSEEKRKAAQRAAWIKKLQAKRPIK